MFGFLLAFINVSLAVADKIENDIFDAKYREECRKRGDIVYMASLGKHRLVSNNRPVIERTDANGDFVVEDLYTHEVYYNYSEANRIKKEKEYKQKQYNISKTNEEIKKRAKLNGEYSYKKIDEVGYRRVEDDVPYFLNEKLLRYRYSKYISVQCHMLKLGRGFFGGYKEVKPNFNIKELNNKEREYVINIVINDYNKMVDKNIFDANSLNNKSECLKAGVIFEHITVEKFMEKYGDLFK